MHFSLEDKYHYIKKIQNMENYFRVLCVCTWYVSAYPTWSKLIVEDDCLYIKQISKLLCHTLFTGSRRRHKWRRVYSIWNGPFSVGTCASMVGGTVFPGTEIKPEFGMI